jgi:peptidoglycan/LPS O-acetylase OafA/YrhL
MNAPLGSVATYQTRIHLPALDGLRFLAFAAVFVHHSPGSGNGIVDTASAFGWVGVELFFVISAFLFFHLLEAEYRVTGRISVRQFYVRRALRIYPLIIIFPLLSALVAGVDFSSFKRAYFALLTGTTNVGVARNGYETSIPYGQHLWTISSEMQIYLVLPFIFIAYTKMARSAFLTVLLCVGLAAVALQGAAVAHGATHPAIWVTPYLRPESVLVGIALAISRPLVSPIVVAGFGIFAILDLVTGANVQQMLPRQLAIYPRRGRDWRRGRLVGSQSRLGSQYPE